MFNEMLMGKLEEIVLRRIAEDKLVLPSVPAVAARCQELAREPNPSVREIVGILEREPVSAARLLRLSPGLAGPGGGKIPALTEMLSRLGAKNLRGLLTEIGEQRMFMSRNPQIAAATRGMWTHATAVAIVSRDITALTGAPDSSGAYMAGLLHDVGKCVVAAILLEAERQITEVRNGAWISSVEWVEVIRRTHRKVGTQLAEKWNLPESIALCIRDVSEYDAVDRASVVNPVCLGNAVAKQAGLVVEAVDQDDVKALVMIGRSLLGVTESVVTALAVNLKDRVSNVFDAPKPGGPTPTP